MKDAARSSECAVAILKPQIPIGSDQSAGWFGGNAQLPTGTAWPEMNGQKLLFVGQVNLAALPKDLWSGLGPRTGWLAIFLPGSGDAEPTVLHFDGPLVETKAPLPNDAGWTRNFNFEEPRTFALPRWPIIVESKPGHELHQDGAAAPKDDPQGSISFTEAYHPFDQATTFLLLRCLGECVTLMARKIVQFPAMKMLRPDDAAWFRRQQSIILETFVRFFEIEGQILASGTFDERTISSYVAQLAQLDAYDSEYLRNDEAGYAEVVLRETKLLDLPSTRSNVRRWWNGYDAGLINHGLKAYTTDPKLLPQPLRQRLEAHWQSETRFGLGMMGHAPMGHIYTPHGPDSPNEVLLELHTSKLTGWIWGDCYSLVLLIDREDLRCGDFSSIQVEITN